MRYGLFFCPNATGGEVVGHIVLNMPSLHDIGP